MSDPVYEAKRLAFMSRMRQRSNSKIDEEEGYDRVLELRTTFEQGRKKEGSMSIVELTRHRVLSHQLNQAVEQCPKALRERIADRETLIESLTQNADGALDTDKKIQLLKLCVGLDQRKLESLLCSGLLTDDDRERTLER